MTRSRTFSREEAAEVFQREINGVTRIPGNALESIPAGYQSTNDFKEIIDAYKQLKALTLGEVELGELDLDADSEGCNLTLRKYIRIARGEQEEPIKINMDFLAALHTLRTMLEEQEIKNSSLAGRLLAALCTLVSMLKKQERQK